MSITRMKPRSSMKCCTGVFQAERYEVEVDETRITHAAEVFGKYLKTDDCEAVNDVVTKQVIDDASEQLEGDYCYYF